METWAIVLAAGTGRRYGGAKAGVRLRGQRLVDLAVATASRACDRVVVVLPAATPWDGAPVAAAVAGGPTRAASVRAGLAAIPAAADVVVVHDAAHPLATAALFAAVIDALGPGVDGAVPVVATAESLGRLEHGRLVATEAAASAVLVQMPHAFRAAALRAAHAGEPDATDDASLVIARGGTIVTVPGEGTNIHVTTPDDLVLAARLSS